LSVRGGYIGYAKLKRYVMGFINDRAQYRIYVYKLFNFLFSTFRFTLNLIKYLISINTMREIISVTKLSLIKRQGNSRNKHSIIKVNKMNL
jgi:hypothetical protein